MANLVGNAVAYGAENTPIRVMVEGDDQGALLSVTNQGEAIAPGDLPNLLDPLRRGTTANAESVLPSTHLGLGLFIVKEIARAHGGDVTLRSCDGTTTLLVRFGWSSEGSSAGPTINPPAAAL